MTDKFAIKRIIALICALLLLTPVSAAAAGVKGTAGKAEDGGTLRAVWVSSVLNLDFPSEPGLSGTELRAEINAIIARVKQLKLNAVILQVRPSGDALYKSDVFPWSEYLSGTRGAAPTGNFDPLAYWVRQAHRNGLELHAWINPYRITHANSGIGDVSALPAGDPARNDPSRAVAYNGALYYDPGRPSNQSLIMDGVAEIVKKYDVDGIHLDDYFYPGADFPDDASYAAHGGDMDRDDWRRDNVNDLIFGIREIITELKPGVRFGVSPAGIWQNASSSPLGSDTRGNESYGSVYADTRLWVKEGWVDYICPQIYWTIGYEIADYAKLVAWWADVCEDTGVDLYVGHAAYKEAEEAAAIAVAMETARESGDTLGANGTATGKSARIWSGELVRQLELNARLYPDIVKGDIFFRYGSLTGPVGRRLRRHYTDYTHERLH